jgi:glycosyltransferase involved in cell wall biosynthesis
VLEAICDLYPEAPLFTLVHARGRVSPAIERRRVRTSFVQRLPAATRQYRRFRLPAAVELRSDGFDLVISTSHCAVKSVGPGGRMSYRHSPMRYADQLAYFARHRWAGAAACSARSWPPGTGTGQPAGSTRSSPTRGMLRPDPRYYNRESTVVYPPVDTAFYRPDDARRPPRSGFLVVSALVPYKRIDVAIEACRRLGTPLTIVGSCPEMGRPGSAG